MVKRKLSKKQVYSIGIFLLIVVAFSAFFIGRFTATKLSFSQGNTTLSSLKNKQVITKVFLFPVKNDSGSDLTHVKYQIDSAELQNEIMLNGQRATAINGKYFLILNIKMTNDFDKSFQINSRDYIRLSMNKKPELFAPNMHNDPVQVDAISTKYTRLGFTINQSDSHLVLHVGEIDGNKTILPLTITSN